LAQDAGVSVTAPGTPWPLLVMGIAYLLVLGTVLFGPQPRRVTRWAAFWVVTVPLGIGVLWLLAREAPWSRTASALPEPLPHSSQKDTPAGDARFTGGPAFLVAVMAGVGVGIVRALVWV
jgi:hypothetical protein